ncbi:MAG TPA: hypothetical protein VLE22_23025 [Bryobacteraceae bacterium]|nr:hypothetical protein [Bryobacteraceae bacterium]
MITYRTGNNLDMDQVIELYRASTLGERRPIDERERMGEMLRNANLGKRPGRPSAQCWTGRRRRS